MERREQRAPRALSCRTVAPHPWKHQPPRAAAAPHSPGSTRLARRRSSLQSRGMGANGTSRFGKDDAHTILLHNGPATMWVKTHISLPAAESAKEKIICSIIPILGSCYIRLLPRMYEMTQIK